MKRQRLLLLVGFALSIAAGAWFAPEPLSSAPAASAGEITVDWPALPERVKRDIALPNLFASRTWTVLPPQPVVRVAPPPAPSAPPMPFTYLGRAQTTQEQMLFFLARGERVYTVRLGEVIDESYQIESLANGQLTFMYLPLKLRQSLTIGNDS